MRTLIIAIVGLLIGSFTYADDIQIYCDDAPPTNFRADDGTVTGFTTDIVREIQKRVGNVSEIEIYPWKRAYLMALKKPGIVLFTASRNPDRENKFHWIIQVTTRRSALFSKAGSSIKINSLDEAKKVRNGIGVLRGGNREKYLKNLGFTNLYSVNIEKQSIILLVFGRIDLIFMSTLEAVTLARINGISFKEIEHKFTVYSNDSYVMMSKNGTSSETVKMWKNAAQQIKDDGTFKKIGDKWVKHIHRNYGVETEVRDNVLFFWKE
ncbi:MAG: ABC transporter substrate-binding protein [Deltaproteobacteria bacterium]|nr:ABC transporter substrate-binding protein [Deltaproteobacteria bacterium]